MTRETEKIFTKKLELIAQGCKVGEIIMAPKKCSTIVRVRGERIIPQGEYFLTSPSEIDSMISKRIESNKLPYEIKRYY